MNDNIVSDEHENYLRKLKVDKIIILSTQIVIFIMFFGLWELCAYKKLIDPFIFSTPSRIFVAAVSMIKEGTLFLHIFVTLGETVVGFVVSTVLGTVFAVFLWANSFLQKTLDPYLVVLNSLPKTALAPIIIVIFGTSVKSIIITSILTSIIVTILTVLTGFMEVNKERIKLIYTFGGTKKDVLLKVVLPASVPSVFNALKINIGLSFVGVIVGEFLVAKAGLGYLIVYGSQIFKMDWVMLGVIVLCFLASFLYKFISYIEKKFV